MPIDSESENRVLNGSSTSIRPMLTVRVLLFMLICFSFRILVGGTIERWEDPFFRKCFEKILNGNWRDHDPFSLEGRWDARSSLYGRPSQSSIFRTFQGWLAMRYRFHWPTWLHLRVFFFTDRWFQSSETAPTQGTLRVYPDVLLTNAYTILRPFFSPTVPSDSKDIYDVNNWKFGKSW